MAQNLHLYYQEIKIVSIMFGEQPKTILLVDDEELNLDVLSEYLEEENYNILTARNGKEALDILNDRKNEITAIVLDRMMPVMNGMELMNEIKSNLDLDCIPVVMQSAAAAPHEIREGIEAGVFYYITKPFAKELFMAILESALEYSIKNISLKSDYEAIKSSFYLLDEAKFSINKKSQIVSLCEFISNAFPKPEKAYFGINELLLNAHEHGNLGITYNEKKELLIKKYWHKEIERRESLPANKGKKIFVEYRNTDNYHEITITDQGDGFGFEEYLDFDESRAIDPNGRGIAMVKKYSFDEVIFEDNGRKVIARVRK